VVNKVMGGIGAWKRWMGAEKELLEKYWY